jgi:hypothetical protein
MLAPDVLPPLERVVAPMMVVRRVRVLDAPGLLRVTPGDHLEPDDVVAEVEERAPVRILDGPSALGVPAAAVAALLRVKVSEPVQEGQLLAQHGTLFKRALRSPMNGTLASVENGRLTLRGEPRRRQVRAIMPGTVIRVIDEQRFEVEGHGALIQGIWGNGREAAGLLRLLVHERGESIPADIINLGFRGTVLLTGATANAAVLLRAREVQVRALILGSLDASLVPLARSLPFPVLLTEGFGAYPINPLIFALLEKLEGREVSLTTTPGPGGAHSRPELFAPLAGDAMHQPPSSPLRVGNRVRVLTGPYLGRLGRVHDSAPARAPLPSGVITTTWEIELEDGELIRLPLTNLERLVHLSSTTWW